jgi:uncharacterized protein (TIGR00251 family)
MEDCVRVTKEALYLDIKAVPGASKTGFAGIRDKRLRVRIAAAPEDGKANEELVHFVAKALSCPKRDIRFASGEKSRLKTLALPPEYAVQLGALIAEVT